MVIHNTEVKKYFYIDVVVMVVVVVVVVVSYHSKRSTFLRERFFLIMTWTGEV
jgi:hypothetical protein